MLKIVQLAVKRLRRNKRRSSLSAGTVALGTLAVLLAAGFMEASFFQLRETTIRTDIGHIQIEDPRYAGAASESPLEYGLDQVSETKRIAASQSAARYAMARLDLQGIVSVGDRSAVFVGRGVEPDKEEPFAAAYAPITQGRGLASGAGDHQEIVLAEGLAAKLGAQVGDWATVMTTTEQGGLNGMDFKVVGIVDHFIPEYSERFAVMPLPAAQELMRTHKVSRLVVVLRDTERTDATVSALAEKLPGLAVVPWYTRALYYRDVVNLYHTIFGFLGTFIVLIVVLTSFSALTMAVMERIPEVATMMAIGVPRSKIMWSFLWEGGLLGLLGAVGGALLAIAVALLVNAAELQMPPPPGGTRGYSFELALTPSYYLAVPLIAMLASMAAAYLPARHASRLNISWALRHR